MVFWKENFTIWFFFLNGFLQFCLEIDFTFLLKKIGFKVFKKLVLYYYLKKWSTYDK